MKKQSSKYARKKGALLYLSCLILPGFDRREKDIRKKLLTKSTKILWKYLLNTMNV